MQGIEYVTYAGAVAHIEKLSDEEAEALVRRFGFRVRDGHDPRAEARAVIRDDFDERTLSNKVVRTGKPTLYDKDPRAIAVVERVLADIEKETSGYAFEIDSARCTQLVWFAMALSEAGSKLGSVNELWSIKRALDYSYPIYFVMEYAEEVAEMLDRALSDEGVPDSGIEAHRCVEGLQDAPVYSFISVRAYDEFLVTELPKRRAISMAVSEFHSRFGQACGPFNLEKAKQTYQEFGHAMYFDNERMAVSKRARGIKVDNPLTADRSADVAAGLAKNYPITKGSKAAYEKFVQKELDTGFSPYGYWFAPDGTAHAMANWQDHVNWMAKHLGVPSGLVRIEAMLQGWVSMTMAADVLPGANIAYIPSPEAQKALKAAARMVRRGGNFANVIIEAYDEHYNVVSYETIDDVKIGVRRLNEIASTVKDAGSSGPSLG